MEEEHYLTSDAVATAAPRRSCDGRPPVASHEPARISASPTADAAPSCSSSTITPSATATSGLK